jgi:hypothetical protein
MPNDVVSIARRLRGLLREFDPAVWSGADCALLVAELGAVGKACASAAARAAARAASCGAHREAGFADPVDWLARESGSSLGAAAAALRTVDGLDACPATRDAVVAGELSLAQADEIVRTESARPGSESELLGVATSAGLGTLRERARARRVEAIDRDELHRRRGDARTFRHWIDELGMVAFRGALPPEVGVPFVNRLDAETDRVWRGVARGGAPAAREQCAADAFVSMLDGKGRGRAGSADVVVVVDLRALRRGTVEGDEVCHVIGGGPIPVSVARDFLEDGFIKAVVHDGVQIHSIAHLGRYKKAELRTALALGAAPAFEGVPCVEPGCDRRYGLEWDHIDPVANDGPTAYDNFAARCRPHHKAKTELDRLAGKLRGGGRVTGRTAPRPPPAPG